MITRRCFTQLSATLLPTLGGVHSARAQSAKEALPDMARIISGFPAGGTADALARRAADRLRGQYAAAVVVDNKPGAGGQIGILNLRDSPADGTSLLITPSSMLSIYPYTYPKLRYTLDDVAPVSLGAMFDHGLAVGPGVPDSVLDARTTWSDIAKYDEQAKKLANMFVENFKTFENDVAPSVKAAGPKV